MDPACISRVPPDRTPLGGTDDVDALSHALYAVRLSGAVFFLVNAAPRWIAEVPPGAALGPVLLGGARQVISYHVVIAGDCWCTLPGGQSTRLQAGDVIVLPHGDPYSLSSAPGEYVASPVATLLPVFAEIARGALPRVMHQGGAGPPRIQLACGFLGHDALPFNPVFAALPRLIQMRVSDTGGADRLSGLLQFALTESSGNRVGRNCVLVRISELLFVELVRRYIVTQPRRSGWLAGLRDPVVARALAALHEHASHAWTVELLAKKVAVSRATLALRFAHIVGEPPMQYLRHWRMQLAARLLRDGGRKISEVAESVGYGSEAAFTRAFKTAAGVSPATWRDRT